MTSQNRLRLKVVHLIQKFLLIDGGQFHIVQV